MVMYRYLKKQVETRQKVRLDLHLYVSTSREVSDIEDVGQREADGS